MPYALFQYNVSQRAPKHSLTKIRIFYSLWNPVETRPKLNVHTTFRRRPGRLFPVSCVHGNSTNCIKLGENQQGVVYEAKHKPCMSGIIIPSWLSKIILALQQSFRYYVWFLWKNKKQIAKIIQKNCFWRSSDFVIWDNHKNTDLKLNKEKFLRYFLLKMNTINYRNKKDWSALSGVPILNQSQHL